MKRRCGSPADPAFPSYGGRGIRVCPEWGTFVGFLDWALSSGYADDRDIDRINADGSYEPVNCRWVPPIVNTARSALDRSGAYLSTLSGSLTEAAVADAKPRDQTYRLADGGGLVLCVAPTGTKSWRWKYRRHGREFMLTFGQWPTLSLEDGRELAAASRRKLNRGLDPRPRNRQRTFRKVKQKPEN